METKEFNIKGMVCNRCIQTISEKLQIAGFILDKISLGKVKLKTPVPVSQMDIIRSIVASLGFELLSAKKEALLSNLKEALSTLIDLNSSSDNHLKLSDYLAQEFNKNYDSLAEFFSINEGQTLEQYYIALRVDKVKEMLVYTDFSLNEIAYRTGYSSPHHLSSQFKKVTGLNPSHFKSLRDEKLGQGTSNKNKTL